jgi:hypothetical protein
MSRVPSLTRTTLAALVAGVTLLLAFVAGLVAGRVTRKPTPTESSAPVVEAVKKIARLATVEMQVADVVKYQEVRTLVVFDVPKNATLRVRGTVLGGFDLGKGFDVTAEPRSRVVRVSLPAPEILSVDAKIEWFDERSGWLNPITPEDRTRWTTWARAALGRAAKDAGLHARATTHARELVVDTAAALGWKAQVSVAGAPHGLE